MSAFPLALLVGLLAGFFGAIPPGPLNVTIIRKCSRNDRHDAFRVAVGGSLVDALICAGIGFGLSWVLVKVVTNLWVKGTLALFLLAYGLKILLWDRHRDEMARAADRLKGSGEFPSDGRARRGGPLSFFVGLLQGAANPALFVNWTLLTSFLIGHRILRAGFGSAAGFAIGVGLGVFSWFTLLIELVEKLKDHPLGAWLSRSTLVAGALLVLFGLYFTVKSAGEF